MVEQCRHCHGRGFHYVERGSSLTYTCEDCGGCGYVATCPECGMKFPAVAVAALDGGRCPECEALHEAELEREELEKMAMEELQEVVSF